MPRMDLSPLTWKWRRKHLRSKQPLWHRVLRYDELEGRRLLSGDFSAGLSDPGVFRDDHPHVEWLAPDEYREMGTSLRNNGEYGRTEQEIRAGEQRRPEASTPDDDVRRLATYQRITVSSKLLSPATDDGQGEMDAGFSSGLVVLFSDVQTSFVAVKSTFYVASQMVDAQGFVLQSSISIHSVAPSNGIDRAFEIGESTVPQAGKTGAATTADGSQPVVVSQTSGKVTTRDMGQDGEGERGDITLTEVTARDDNTVESASDRGEEETALEHAPAARDRVDQSGKTVGQLADSVWSFHFNIMSEAQRDGRGVPSVASTTDEQDNPASVRPVEGALSESTSMKGSVTTVADQTIRDATIDTASSPDVRSAPVGASAVQGTTDRNLPRVDDTLPVVSSRRDYVLAAHAASFHATETWQVRDVLTPDLLALEIALDHLLSEPTLVSRSVADWYSKLDAFDCSLAVAIALLAAEVARRQVSRRDHRPKATTDQRNGVDLRLFPELLGLPPA